MSNAVTGGTKNNQIVSSVIAELAPRPNVMNLEILHPPAYLAAPAVPLQNFLTELLIVLKFQFQAWPSSSNYSQGAT
jgi:hypothetical protein